MKHGSQTMSTMMFHTKNCGRLEAFAAQQKPGYCRVSPLDILLTVLFQTLTNLCRRHSCSQLIVLVQIVRIIVELSTSSTSVTSRSLTIVTVKSCTAVHRDLFQLRAMSKFGDDFAKILAYFRNSLTSGKKVTFSHTRYRALGPELIPRYRQSACKR